MPFVLDCSMTMAWVFADEACESADAIRDSLTDDHAIVPALWAAEVGNVLLTATRRQRISRHDWQHVAAGLKALPIEIEPESKSRVFDAVLPLAHEARLSVYDATYLEIALRQGLALATLDQRLLNAAREHGVRVL